MNHVLLSTLSHSCQQAILNNILLSLNRVKRGVEHNIAIVINFEQLDAFLAVINQWYMNIPQKLRITPLTSYDDFRITYCRSTFALRVGHVLSHAKNFLLLPASEISQQNVL